MLKDGRADRRHHHRPHQKCSSVHRQTDRAGAELRRPGGDRHREHAAAQRVAPAHRRSDRVAGAADRDVGGAEGHLQLRRAISSRCFTPCWRTPRESARPSSATWYLYEDEAFPRDGDAQRAAGVCRIPADARRWFDRPRQPAGVASSQTKQPIQIGDVREDPSYAERRRAVAQFANWRRAHA